MTDSFVIILAFHHDRPETAMSLFIIWFDLQNPIKIKLGLFKILQFKIFQPEPVISPSAGRVAF